MRREYKRLNRRKPTFAFYIVLLILFALMALIIVFSYKIIKGKPNTSSLSSQNIESLLPVDPNSIEINPPEAPAIDNVANELRGVWVASVLNIDFPTKQGENAKTLKAELNDILNVASSSGLNAVFFQVRPTADALYKSEIFPTSHWLTGKQGEKLIDDFDPLAYMIEESHKRNIKLHVWINPYRVTANKDFTKEMLAEKSPARLHPEWTVTHTDEKIYFDPGIPEVNKLIIDGVAELVTKYNVDGVHFDDYFYPSDTFDDDATYEKYKGSFTDKADWRRNNVNMLIKDTYAKVKSLKKDVLFGVSPFGVWANKAKMTEGSDTSNSQSYFDHFGDSRKWVKEGWLDYICPQIYWSFATKGTAFNVLCDWWEQTVKGTKVKLYVGHPVYKLDETKADWKSGVEIINQIKYARQKSTYGGSVFYGYSQIKKNYLGIKDLLYSLYDKPANVNSKLTVANPTSGTVVTSETSYVLGGFNPAFPLLLNGKAVHGVTDSGLFSATVPLKLGENSLNFTNGSEKLTLKITRKSESTLKYMSTFEIKECFPDESNLLRQEGETVTLSVVAPAGCKAYAMVDGQKVELKTETKAPVGGKMIETEYKGDFVLPSKANGGIVGIGKPVFTIEGFSKKASREAKSEIRVKSAGFFISCEAKEDYFWLRPVPNAGKLYDCFVGYKGLADTITGEEYIYDEKEAKNATFVRLGSGFWLEKDKVNITENKALSFGAITSATINNTLKYTLLTLETTQNAPCTVSAFSDKIVVTVFHVGSFTNALPEMVENPLFGGVSAVADGDKYTYTLSLKKTDSYYGYKIGYENGKINISLKNPSKLVSAAKPLTGIKIALDAGHGTTPGATGPLGLSGLMEKDINISLAQKVKTYLEGYGANVAISRTEKDGLDVRDITAFFRSQSPDLALSIHNNSVNFSSDAINVIGVESYYANQQSKKAAELILGDVANFAKRQKRQAAQGDYIVCRNMEFPTLILEAAFMSNIFEYNWLSKDINRDYYAKCIALSVVDYFKWQNLK